jgi:hypothetical protein
VLFIVGPSEYRSDLVQDATTAWNEFVDEIGTLPFEYDKIRFDWNARSISGVAGALLFAGPRYPREFALMLVSPGFFQRERRERTLTLLHECSHLRFMLGTMRGKVIETIELERTYGLSDDVTDPEERRFLSQRIILAFDYRNFVDEIVAEFYLKTTYPAYARDRLLYYLDMRRGSSKLWQQAEPSLRPAALLYEILRNELGVRLSESEPQGAEFKAMSIDLDRELRQRCSSDEYAQHLAIKDRLLRTTLEPLTYDDAAITEAFMSVMQISFRRGGPT